jgi:hypothetical protein
VLRPCTVAFTLVAVSMANAQSPSPSEVKTIAEGAYIYAYPLVLLEKTMAALPVNSLVQVSS